jgi:hypothetical protein
MRNRGSRFGFLKEALHHNLIAAVLWPQYFDRRLPAQHDVFRAIHFAHATYGEAGADAVPA